MVKLDAKFLDDYVPYVLRRADQTLSAPFYDVLTQYGVARSEWRVLAVLHARGQLCVADLTTAALSPQPTVTHAVRRLEKRDLVSRTPGVDDRRQRFIAITAAGATLTAALVKEAKRLEAAALADAGDLSTLVDQLRVLTASIEAQVAQTNDAALAG